jgi:hypothetical protein
MPRAVSVRAGMSAPGLSGRAKGKSEMKYRVRYYAGHHTGAIEVKAENDEHALALVRARLRRELTTAEVVAQVVAQVDDSAGPMNEQRRIVAGMIYYIVDIARTRCGWAILFECGHGRIVDGPIDKPPHGSRKCWQCSGSTSWWVLEQSKRVLESIPSPDLARCLACGHTRGTHVDGGCALCGCAPFVGPGFEVAP